MKLPRQERWELAVAAALVLLAALALYLYLDSRPQRHFREAAARINARLGPGEVVLLHPPGNALYLDCLPGLPVLASATLKKADLEGVAGVWLVTDLPAQALKTHRVLRQVFKKSGRADYEEVSLFHFWAPKNQGSAVPATIPKTWGRRP
jgi:hypothetical protein